ncbi:MAG TPA: hypothetical protein VGL38_13245 [bacterium]|jgi:cbb3-type cytochrome oxidase subunit 3
MIHDVFSHLGSVWPRVGLLIFLLFFAVVLAWTLRGGRHRFDYERSLPLDDGLQPQNADSDSQRISHEQG